MKGTLPELDDWSELYRAIDRGDYDSQLPLTTKDERAAYRLDQSRLDAQFSGDLRTIAEKALRRTMEDEQWGELFGLAYDEGHSSGYLEVAYHVHDYLAIVWKFL